MIPTALAILTYQLLAILGAEAINQVVTAIAYRRRDLGFRLMYTQSILDVFKNYQKFDLKTHHKSLVILFTGLTMTLAFIPTILTKLHATGTIYYNTIITPLNKADAIALYHWPTTMPVFDNFMPYLDQENYTQLMSDYLKANVGQNVTQNRDGYWFSSQFRHRFAWNDLQRAKDTGFLAYQNADMDAIITLLAFGFRPGDTVIPAPVTLDQCDDDILYVVNTIPSTHSLQVMGLKKYSRVCYPIYDETLSIIIADIFPNDNVSSVLNANDTIFRQMQHSQGTLASSTFGVSIFNHNSTHMTMGVKRTAHITLYSHDKAVIPPSECANSSSSQDRAVVADNFIDLPYNGVLCDLLNARSNLSIIQGGGRAFINNYALRTVYTIQKGNQFEKGDSIMIDFSILHAFTVEGNLHANKELLVAYSSNTLKYDQQPGGPIAVDLSNDTIGTLLKALDPTRLDQTAIDYLVGMATMKVRWENNDYSDIAVNTSHVLDAIQTPSWWIITVIAMAVAFLIPHAGRVFVRHIPEYSKDLRTLLLLTIDRSDLTEDKNKKTHVGISLYDENSRCALLSVNNRPIRLGDHLNSSEIRLIHDNSGKFSDNKSI